ncbi:hypothetical protein PHISCL_01217 [Aspergillus sclerotialis]|uniref:TeaA receptor TeaR n=1 Tax=Aspergillus sclerotialis TaxID=2070753 RepID=A0A3A2ZTL7_9EURO|nr:hypothetical protein PHISCL_01217 [Aspergillus sclerotialis]
MAGAATAAYSADVLTSSATVDGHHQQWEYAVPTRQDSFNHRSKSRSSHDSNSRRKSRDRTSKGSRSSSMSRQAYVNDWNSARGRRDASLNRRTSESGSWRDVYGQETANWSAGNVGDSVDSHYNGHPEKDDMDTNDENWIHRDKLARIESEELQQAAILLQRRAGVESRTGRGKSHELHHKGGFGSSTSTPAVTEQSEPWPNLHVDQGEHTSSSGPDGDGNYDIEDERQNWDLRRPEEIAADKMDDGGSYFYYNPALRKSSSRIPISTASPAPISPDHFGRESRKQRSRAPTNGDDDSSVTKVRRASEPTAAETASASTPTGGSRPVSRGTPTGQNASAKKTPRGTSGSSNRKTSAPPTTRKTTPRSRAVSGNGGSGQRPTTRSGETRPTTSVNRPEGDPPWLATMYKPDPRIPPDQQILPTHARKMQQEQWEKEGRTTTTYDRDFTPLAVRPDEQSSNNDKPEKEEPKPEEKPEEVPEEKKEEQKEPSGQKAAEWPLGSPKNEGPNNKPGVSTGYSTIPKVRETPAPGLSPNWDPPVVTAQPPPEKEKGCGCCIVM